MHPKSSLILLHLPVQFEHTKDPGADPKCQDVLTISLAAPLIPDLLKFHGGLQNRWLMKDVFVVGIMGISCSYSAVTWAVAAWHGLRCHQT